MTTPETQIYICPTCGSPFTFFYTVGEVHEDLECAGCIFEHIALDDD